MCAYIRYSLLKIVRTVFSKSDGNGTPGAVGKRFGFERWLFVQLRRFETYVGAGRRVGLG